KRSKVMATNRLRQLEARGQSIWQDNITRDQLTSGSLKKLVTEDGISGITSNPTIFQKAISGSSAYDEDVTRLARQGKNPDTIADKAIEAKLTTTSDSATRARLNGLVGKAAVANARLAYARFEDLFNPADERWSKLIAARAQVQRPLWASTSMKNPARRDVYYVEELIAPYTINPMPPQTIDAFRD